MQCVDGEGTGDRWHGLTSITHLRIFNFFLGFPDADWSFQCTFEAPRDHVFHLSLMKIYTPNIIMKVIIIGKGLVLCIHLVKGFIPLCTGLGQCNQCNQSTLPLYQE